MSAIVKRFVRYIGNRAEILVYLPTLTPYGHVWKEYGKLKFQPVKSDRVFDIKDHEIEDVI